MDLSLSVEQEILRESVHRCCQDRFQKKTSPPNGSVLNREHWEVFASLGWLGILLDEDVGGTEGSIIDASIILEEFGRNLVIEPYLPCAILAARAIHRATNAELRKSLLTSLVRGELIIALAHAETAARGNTAFVETTAQRTTGGGYELNGRKTLVLAGSFADKFVVSARAAHGLAGGMALFVVDRDAPGLCRRDYLTIDGRAAADLALENVEVGPDALLASEEQGLAAIEEATDFAMIGLCSEAIGGMDKVVKATTEYLKTRRAYGSTLSKFQALQHRIADMLIELELSRSMLYCAFAAFNGHDQRKRRRMASATKALIGRSTKFVSSNGIQLHGAQGMADDYLIGQHFKQLAVVEGLFGSSDYHWEQSAPCCLEGLFSGE